MNDESVYECPRCQIGFCKPHAVTFARIHNGHVVSAPHTPRYTCDICGYQEFEPEALERLLRLVGESLKKPAQHTRRRPAALPTEGKPKRKPRKNANT